MPRRSHHLPRLAVAAIVTSLLASCADKPSPGSDAPTTPGAIANTAAPINAAALLPERLRIHPLTRFLREDNARLDLIVHLELRDHFGQAVKGLGIARIELDRPTGIAGSGAQAQEAVWEIDLRDPTANSEAYDDLITRTYTLPLTDLPESIDQWVGEPAPTDASNPSGLDWLLIKALFTFHDPSGQEHRLEATYRMTR